MQHQQNIYQARDLGKLPSWLVILTPCSHPLLTYRPSENALAPHAPVLLGTPPRFSVGVRSETAIRF